MKRNPFLILFLFLSLRLEAQNIVQNGGFDSILTCPNSPGDIWVAEYWVGSGGSPDLYNECGTSDFGVPSNKLGYQNAKSGKSYISIATYSENGIDAREFAQAELKYPLEFSENYYVEFYVSQADSLEFATHNIGVTLTETSPSLGYLECYPGCEVYYENTSANSLSSKTEWVKVSGTFTAQGGERFLHIGNFRTDADSEIEFVGGGVRPWIAWNEGGYYIDDVWLSHIDSMGYVGVNEQLPMSNEQYLIYPNPSTGVVTVDYACSGNDVATLNVFDTSGRAVFKRTNICGATTVELNSLPNGVYHCILTTSSAKTLHKKLVILHQ